MWVYGCVSYIVSGIFKIVCENIETKQDKMQEASSRTHKTKQKNSYGQMDFS